MMAESDDELRIRLEINPNPPHERGVFEVFEIAPDGIRRFSVWDSSGEWIKAAEIPEHLVTEDDIQQLWDHLNRVDPRPVFQVVR